MRRRVYALGLSLNFRVQVEGGLQSGQYSTVQLYTKEEAQSYRWPTLTVTYGM